MPAVPRAAQGKEQRDVPADRLMKPVSEYRQIRDDLIVWNSYNPECRTDCSSTAIRTQEGFVLVDPLRLQEQAVERILGEDRVIAVLLTNGNHLRGSLYEKERFGISIYAPELAEASIPADYLVKTGEMIFRTLKVISVAGAGPGESAYLAGDVLIVGDALTNLDGLHILPEKYCENTELLRESLQHLCLLNFDTICFAHGLPIVGGAKESVARIVEAEGTPRDQ